MAGDAAVLVVELVVVVVVRDAATLTFVVHAPATRATRSMSANDVVLRTARVFHGLTPSPSTLPGSATVLSDGMKECRRLPHSCRAVSTVPATAASSERF
jgi:hypothetical protein